MTTSSPFTFQTPLPLYSRYPYGAQPFPQPFSQSNNAFRPKPLPHHQKDFFQAHQQEDATNIAAKPADDHKNPTGEKQPKVHPIGFLFPAMTLVGTPLMLITSLLGVQNKNGKIVFEPNSLMKGLQSNRFVKATMPSLATKTISSKQMIRAYSVGKNLLALGIIPKTIIGMMYGIKSEQPSMLFAHLLQLPLTPLIMREVPIATSLAYMMGGLFTLGFVNDVQNEQLKEGLKGVGITKPRKYDMSTMKGVFDLHNSLPMSERFSRFAKETGKMSLFVLEDHWLTTKRAFKEMGNLLAGRKSGLTDIETVGSVSKSSLGFLLCYMGTIPAIMSGLLLKGKGVMAERISKLSIGLTILSGLFLNFGMVLVAIAGKNWAEKIPLVGTGMELSGTLVGYSTNSRVQPFAVALQQMGAGLNNIFFANRAQGDD